MVLPRPQHLKKTAAVNIGVCLLQNWPHVNRDHGSKWIFKKKKSAKKERGKRERDKDRWGKSKLANSIKDIS